VEFSTTSSSKIVFDCVVLYYPAVRPRAFQSILLILRFMVSCCEPNGMMTIIHVYVSKNLKTGIIMETFPELQMEIYEDLVKKWFESKV
jgi:hypothetical protein